MREGNSKHWERKDVLKAAATAYLYEIIMVQNRDQGLPLCSWKGNWGNRRKKKRWMFIIAILECVYFHYKVRGTDNVEVNILKEQQLSMSSLWASTTRILLGKTPKILCDPMNHSTPALPVHHQPPEFTQTHIH